MLALGLVATWGCDRTSPAPRTTVATARALQMPPWEQLRLLPAAAVAPPPTHAAPAFERPSQAREGYSIGPSNAGSLSGPVPLPADHPSLKIRPIAATRNAYFGTPGLVAMLTKAAERVAREYPGSVLWAGDLSLPDGGSLAPHASHTSGRDVDLSFYVSRDGVPADGPAMRNVDGEGRVGELRFDVARNWALVASFLEDPNVTPQWIFCAHHVRALLLAYARDHADARLVQRAEVVLAQPGDSSPHADHFHVRIYCGLAERMQGCLDAAPFHAWAPRYDDALTAWLEALLPFLREPRLPETREAIERIVRMNATPAIPHLERLIPISHEPITTLARDAVDFLAGRRTPSAWKRWRAVDAAP